MKQNQTKEGLEAKLRVAEYDREKSLFRTVCWVALPVVVFYGISSLGRYVGSQYESESKNWATFFNYGIPAALGLTLGVSGMVGEYLEKFRDFVGDIRDDSGRIRNYRTQLQELK